MGQGHDDYLFLPVRLFNVLRANGLECVKSIVLIAAVYLSRRFSSKRFCNARAALSVASPWMLQKKKKIV